MKIKKSLKNIFYGEITMDDALDAVFGKEAFEFHINKTDENEKKYVWHGVFPPTKVGNAWKPAPAGLYFVPQFYSHLAAIKAAKKNGNSTAFFHKGLTTKNISFLNTCFIEADEGTIKSQAERIDEFEEKTGLIFSCVTLSGDGREKSIVNAKIIRENLKVGKSIHAFLSLKPLKNTKENKALWEKIQKHLIVFFGSDTKIADINRMMRLPSVLGGQFNVANEKTQVRIQTALRTKDKRYDAHYVLAQLQQLNENIDIQSAYKALQTAERLTHAAKREEDPTIKSQLFDTIDKIRKTLEVPADLQLPKMVRKGSYSQILLTSGNHNVTFIDGDTKITAADGRELTLDEWAQEDISEVQPVRCYSPCCAPDKSPAAVIFPNGSIYCHRHEMVIRAKSGAFNNTIETLKEEGIKHTKINNLDYLDLEITKKITLIKAPKGTGKTYLAAKIFEAEKGEGRKIALAHRRSLVFSLAQRLNLPNYLNLKGRIEGDVAICLDSLPRLNNEVVDAGGWELQDNPIDILFVDEITQVLSAIYSGTMDGFKSLSVFAELQKIIRMASKVIVADADLDSDTINFIIEASKAKKSDIEIVEMIKENPYKYKITTDKAAQRAEIYKSFIAGEKIVVAMFSNNGAKALGKELQKLKKDAKVLVITQDLALNMKDKLKDLTSTIEKEQPDAFIYSPSVGTGVSIENKDYFDRIFGIFYRNVGTRQDALQMIHRVRYPKNEEIYIYTQAGSQKLETNVEKIKHNLQKTAEKLLKRNGKTMGEYTVALNDCKNAEKHFDLYCQKLANERQNGGYGGSIFQAFINNSEDLRVIIEKKEDTNISNATRKSINKMQKATKKEVEDLENEEIANALDIEDENPDPKNRDEELQNRKYKIENFYGAKANKELVERDQKGERRKNINFLNLIRLTDEGKIAQIKEMDIKAIDFGGFTANKNNTIKAKIMYDFLTKMDLIDFIFDKSMGNFKINKEKALEIAQEMKNKKWMKELGFIVAKDAEERPIAFVSTMLKKIGVKINQKRIQKNGKRERVYFIDYKELQQLREDAEYNYNKINK